MESRKGLFIAVVAVLLAAGPLPCRSDYDDYGFGGYGDDYGFGGLVKAKHPVHLTVPNPRHTLGHPVVHPHPGCGNECEGTTCTCTCQPKTHCPPPAVPVVHHPCPHGTIKNHLGHCLPVPKPKPHCPICHICRECVDERKTISVKACLQMHSDNSNSMMCLQGAGISTHSARKLVAARNSPGFMELLESGEL